MREIIDREMLLLLEGLQAALTSELSVFLFDAQALCAIFMILYFGTISYGILAGDERLEVMPLLRPFGIALVIILWPEFISLISVPSQVIADSAKALLSDRIDLIDAIQIERQQKLQEVSRQLIERSTELEQFAASAKDEDWMATLGIDFSVIFDQLKGYYIIVLSKLRWLMMEVLEFITITFYQACSYLIFFIQVVFSSILILLGPFAFALSCLPAFRDAYIGWLARFISVSLYSGLGYLVMSLSMVLIHYGLEKELVLLDYVLSDDAAFLAYISTNVGGENIYLIGLLVGGITMLTIPMISTWVVATTGVGNAISSALRSMYKSGKYVKF